MPSRWCPSPDRASLACRPLCSEPLSQADAVQVSLGCHVIWNVPCPALFETCKSEFLRANTHLYFHFANVPAIPLRPHTFFLNQHLRTFVY